MRRWDDRNTVKEFRSTAGSLANLTDPQDLDQRWWEVKLPVNQYILGAGNPQDGCFNTVRSFQTKGLHYRPGTAIAPTSWTIAPLRCR